MFVRAIPLRLFWHAYSNGEAFVFCPHCEKYQCTHLNVLEQNLSNKLVSLLFAQMFEMFFSSVFVLLYCTMLQLIMLMSKCRNEAALEINVYSHWFHLLCVFLVAIFLGQKSDLLPCSSEMRHCIFMYFQSSVGIFLNLL